MRKSENGIEKVAKQITNVKVEQICSNNRAVLSRGWGHWYHSRKDLKQTLSGVEGSEAACGDHAVPPE